MRGTKEMYSEQVMASDKRRATFGKWTTFHFFLFHDDNLVNMVYIL